MVAKGEGKGSVERSPHPGGRCVISCIGWTFIHGANEDTDNSS